MMRWRVLLLLAAAPQAHAQAVYGIGVASQYSVRGVTLSNGPVPQLSIDWDGDHGSFAGALLTRAHLHYAPSGLAAVAYGGAARRLGAGFSAELGAAAARFQHAARYNYHELFAGVAWERVSARLYHSPHYYGAGGRSVYVN